MKGDSIMSRVCQGCGLFLQCQDATQKGYVPESKYQTALYCERCFRLKHYHEMRYDALSYRNDELIERVNHDQKPVYFFVDLFGISQEALAWFDQITSEKYLVFTKTDLLPGRLELVRFKKHLQKIYSLSGDIFFIQYRPERSYARLLEHMKKQKEVFLFGMTNAGKSQFLNWVSVSEHQSDLALVSEMPNTTQEFCQHVFPTLTIWDAPGLTFANGLSEVLMKSNSKKRIKPVTMPLRNHTVVEIPKLVTFFMKNLLVLWNASRSLANKIWYFQVSDFSILKRRETFFFPVRFLMK